MATQGKHGRKAWIPARGARKCWCGGVLGKRNKSVFDVKCFRTKRKAAEHANKGGRRGKTFKGVCKAGEISGRR